MYSKDKVVQECVEVAEVQDINDNNRISTDKGRPDSKWRRVLRRSLRRWGLFRVSDQTNPTDRHTTRRRDAVRDNLLRPHLFGVIRGRYDGLGR